MSDVVDRLRQLSADAANVECGEPYWWVEVTAKAADEIERLRWYERFVNSNPANQLHYPGWKHLVERREKEKLSVCVTSAGEGTDQ